MPVSAAQDGSQMTAHEPRAEKTALITGGAIRLGRAVALELARLGFDIALHYRASEDQARRTRAEILGLGVRCQTFRQDLDRAEQLEGFVAQVASAMPTLSVLVNSAAYYESGTIAETGLEQFERQFSLNLRAPFFLTRYFAARVGEGLILNIADSKIAFNQYAYAAYLLSKKALAELTRLAAIEYAPRIRVNAICPGVVMPPANQDPGYLRWREEGIPLRRQGDLSHIAQAVALLVRNDYLTGQVLFVDGGESVMTTGRNARQYRTEQERR